MKTIHKPYTKFKGWLRTNELTYQDVGELLGLSVATISSKINGKSDFFLNEIQTIQKQYHLNSDIFFTGDVA